MIEFEILEKEIEFLKNFDAFRSCSNNRWQRVRDRNDYIASIMAQEISSDLNIRKKLKCSRKIENFFKLSRNRVWQLKVSFIRRQNRLDKIYFKRLASLSKQNPSLKSL